MLVRWRAELLLLGCAVAVWHYAGGVVVGLLGLAMAALIAFVPPVRSALRATLQSVIAMHRVRSGLVQAGVGDRRGRLPWIVTARASGEVVLVSVWLNSGTVPDDLRAAAPVIATACGAAAVEILHRSPRRDRAVVAVVRPRWGWPTQ